MTLLSGLVLFIMWIAITVGVWRYMAGNGIAAFGMGAIYGMLHFGWLFPVT